MKQFLYLVQTAKALPPSYKSLYSERSDVLLLTFKEQVEGAIFLPKSTWTQGRNALLQAAREKGDYLYYIFMDDDVLFTKGSFREFEDALLRHEPAIGTPYFPEYFKEKGSINPTLEAQNCYYFDAIYNAFHRDVFRDDVILPYYGGLDKESWWYSQLFIMRLSNTFFPDHTLQINTVWIENSKHEEYPRLDRFKEVVKWFNTEVITKKSGFTDPYLLEKISRRLPSTLAKSIWKAHGPLPKLPSYTISPEKKAQLLNLEAPFWNERLAPPTDTP